MAQKHFKELANFQQEGKCLPQLHIFVVGTFRDQLLEEGRLNEAVQDISKCLKELERKPYYHCIQRDLKEGSHFISSTTWQTRGTKSLSQQPL